MSRDGAREGLALVEALEKGRVARIGDATTALIRLLREASPGTRRAAFYNLEAYYCRQCGKETASCTCRVVVP